MSQKLFSILGKVHNFFLARTWLTKPVHYLLERWAPSSTAEERAWTEDAEFAILEQAPLRAKKILYWMVIILILLIAWAGYTKIDEITRGEGRVIPSQQVQIVQSYDGGIVSELLVHEGETVTKGQPLVKIDQTRAVSSLRENRSQYLSLLARQSRLRALASGSEYVQDEEIKKEAPELYTQEYALYASSKAELASQVAIATEQVKQRQRELAETYARLEQASRSLDLTNQELEVTKPLRESGAVSDVDLLRLERDVAKLRGERNQAREQVGRVKSAIAEAERRLKKLNQLFGTRFEQSCRKRQLS